MWIIMMLMTVLSFTAHAQDTVRMTLRECMSYALAHSAEVRLQQADCRDAQISRREAILRAFTPTVSGDAYAYSNFGRSIDPETNTYSTVTSFHNGYGLSAGIMLFNGFQAVNNLKITKIAEQSGLTKQQQVEDRLCLAVMEAYCNVLYYTELSNAIRAQVNTAEKAMLFAQRQYDLGQKSYSDVLHTKAELSDREYQLTVCSNHLNDAYITLTDIMLYDNQKVLNIDMEWPDSMFGATSSGNEDEAARAMQAVTRLPRVIIANGEYETARIALRTAKWRLLPSLSLYGGWSSTYFTYPGKTGYVPAPYWRQIADNGGEYVQLSLNIPIYDRFSRQSEIARRRNELDRAEARREQAQHEADAEVRRAIADRDGAAEALRQAEQHATLQQELYALSTKQFEQGLTSAVEYQTVADNHLNATAEYLHARLTYFVKCEVVRYYAGLLIKN